MLGTICAYLFFFLTLKAMHIHLKINTSYSKVNDNLNLLPSDAEKVRVYTCNADKAYVAKKLAVCEYR